MILPSIINIVQVCAQLGVRQAILSPGSRCAPLSIAFVRHPQITTRTVSDERSAAFIGLGIARQLREPVVLVCTSGSAAYNYAPAVAEAFFQQIPLIILTADRPPEWIDQLDGQTIRQREIYGRHVKASFELPIGQTDADIWHAGRIMAEAVNLSLASARGPVHINVPLREPFYPKPDDVFDFDQPAKVIRQLTSTPVLSSIVSQDLQTEWNKAKRKLIVCGQCAYDAELIQALQEVSQRLKIPILADVISNMHAVPEAIQHADILLAQKDEAILKKLQPDLLITFGLSVMSKNLKLFLRKYRPQQHWHIQPQGSAADTYQTLTQVIHTFPLVFFAAIQEKHQHGSAQSLFAQDWQKEEGRAAGYMNSVFSSGDKNLAKPNEFLAVQEVLRHLPEQSNLHLANSMAVRYANLVGLGTQHQQVEVFANRGTSGIDGSNSTAVGSALASSRLTVLLTGDLAFFYDRNAFWHNYTLPNLRIVLLNNHAGGIFRMIDGPASQPELEEYFETKQVLNAENTARDFGMSYQQINWDTEGSIASLKEILMTFIEETSGHAKILEIVTKATLNTEVFKQFKQMIQQNYGV